MPEQPPRQASPPPVPADPAAAGGRPGGTLARTSPPGPGLDYAVVRALRGVVADKLASRLRSRPAASEQDRRELGRALIQAEVAEWVRKKTWLGEPAPGRAGEQALAEAVFAAQFGLGRLQPLVDDPGIENIEVGGCDQVWLSYADGRLERGSPVADSDDELVGELQHLAARHGRALSTADPRLHLSLEDGSRLAAMIATVPRPQVVIRRHRVRRHTLNDLAHVGTLDPLLVAFLRALMAARKNIIVTGPQNAGKTTLIGALAHEIHPMERFATVEKEYELFLHEMPDRHPRVVAMQAREGNAETAGGGAGTAGRGAGEVTLRELIVDALRMNLQRIVVGEVRGDEVLPMLQAMTTGEGGSLCTVHARSARHAFERLVTLCLTGAEAMTDTFGYRLGAGAIDFIIHIRLLDETHIGGARNRFVAEVLEVCGMGEGGRPATNQIFGPGPDGRAVPHHHPACLDDLRRAGFDRDLLGVEGGLWAHALDTVMAP